MGDAAAVGPALCRGYGAGEGVPAGDGGGRGAVLQHERYDGDYGRTGAGGGSPGGVQGGGGGRRIYALAGEAGHHLLRSGGEAAGSGDGEDAPEPARSAEAGRRRRRVGHSHLPRLFFPDGWSGQGGGGEIDRRAG